MVQMLVFGHWIDIPSRKIQYRALPGDPGSTGGGHWCGYELREPGVHMTRCAILPPQSASVSRMDLH